MSRVSQSSAGRSSVNIAGPIDVEIVGFDTLTNPPGQVTVGLTSITLFTANPNRKYAHIVNNSGLDIYIQFLNNAIFGQGIKLAPNTLYTIESTNLWLGQINAIGVSASQLIDILEGE